MIKKFVEALFGNYNRKQIKSLEPLVEEINTHFEKFQKYSDTELKSQFSKWKDSFSKNPDEAEEQITEVFGAIKSAATRLCEKTFKINDKPFSWDMIHYDVQLIGGIVLNQGKIAEMKTGEGKTLVCTLPVIFNALKGKGVHVVTVNDYLAQRDAEWMQPLYEFCGLSVGVITNDSNTQDRIDAYQSDITYATNNELGFDYLRDNMAQDSKEIVQRDLYFAIVDEVDSILIDEARTPLIISTAADQSTEKYGTYSKIIPQLVENQDYNIDYKQKSAHLSEAGIKKLEKILGVDQFFTEAGFSEVHHIENALKAEVIMKKDQDYVIREGQAIIIDEFTGRMMSGRRYSDGLHQAIEAKENITIQRESKTLATITFQNYFRLYQKLSGMTGTAETEAEEFAKIYKLDTLVIPTNKPTQRTDLPDKIFKNEKGKMQAICKSTAELHKKGQPVLIGTVNIDQSEIISDNLKKASIPHEVLNAKHHEREAEIISKAGQKSAVTIATNMAGRGTDIKLEEGVNDLGGLAILGTERHESRRIDNQLRGRSGRQGDKGFSQFYVAMTDSLMLRFGGEKMGSIMEKMGLPEEEAIENSMISRSVENAQKKIEGFHFDARKHIVQYDDVMNIHREKIYARRRKLLGSEDILEDIEAMIKEFTDSVVRMYAPTPQIDSQWDVQEIFEIFKGIHLSSELSTEHLETYEYQSDIYEFLETYLLKAWNERKKDFPEQMINEISKQIILRCIDELWLEHIDQMSHLRDRVALAGYAQKDPIMEYKAEAFRMFASLLSAMRRQSLLALFHVRFAETQNFENQTYADAQTNNDQINQALENPQQAQNQNLTRQQRRAIERSQKKNN